MRASLLLFVLLMMAVANLTACVTPSAFKAHSEFVEQRILNNPAISSDAIETAGFRLHYQSAGRANKAVAVWIHGTPGNWTDIAYLLDNQDFLSQVKLVSLDRPGWGESQYIDTPKLVTSFDEIGRLLQPLLRKLKTEHPNVPLLLVGHSWGGSLAPALALDHPELVDGVLVLAAGLDPQLVKPRWYNRFANTWLGNAAIGAALRKANVEIYALRPQMLALDARWHTLRQPIIVVQGDKDRLVDPKNADYAEAVLPAAHSAVVRLRDQGHLLQLERTDLIARCVLALADRRLEHCGGPKAALALSGNPR